jgi:hypothetical protein
VLASPVNCGNATAIFRCFLERLMGYAYWPWGQPAPKPRSRIRTLKAALVATSAMPGFLIPLFTGTRTALRIAANALGARPVASLWVGLSAKEPDQAPGPRVLARGAKNRAQAGLALVPARKDETLFFSTRYSSGRARVLDVPARRPAQWRNPRKKCGCSPFHRRQDSWSRGEICSCALQPQRTLPG